MEARVARAPGFTRIANSVITRLLRIGVPLGPNRLMTVGGRRTGLLRTTPVAVLERGGKRYLFGTFGETNWVRNVRAADQVTIRRGRRCDAYRALELSEEDAVPVLRQSIAPYVKTPILGGVLRRQFHVEPDSPGREFIAEARRHPVFELQPLV